MAFDQPESAYNRGVQRTIPNGRDTVSVSAASQNGSLAKYAGKWVWLKALTLDVTIVRGTPANPNPLVTAGEGFVIAANDAYAEFYVDPSSTTTYGYRSSGAATLVILYDVE
jgi:hypothetical protein